MGQQGSKDSDAPSVVGSSVRAVRNATGDAKGVVKETAESRHMEPGTEMKGIRAVGSESRQAVWTQKERWGRVEEGDTLWSLSEKYLGDATQWETLQSACRRELGTDPLLLLPDSHVTEACIARARALVEK